MNAKPVVCAEWGVSSSIPVNIVELVDFRQGAPLEHGGGGGVDGGEDTEALEEVCIHVQNSISAEIKIGGVSEIHEHACFLMSVPGATF